MADNKTDAKSAVKDILDNRRSFVFALPDGEQRTYFIGDPSGEDIRKADWNYSKVFNQALTDGFPTQAQMIETLKERKIISDDYTNALESTRIQLGAALYRLDNLPDGISDEEKETAALEAASFRDELFRLNQRVNGPLGNTCENLAEDARIEYLTSRVIQDQAGNRIWKTFEDYLKESVPGLGIKCRFEVMLWLQGLDSSFMENSPEQKALREVAQHRLDEALTRINEKPQEEVKEEKPIETISLPEAAPAPARRGRKPGAKAKG